MLLTKERDAQMARNNNPGNCTVTLTHSRTSNLKEITKTADILISAAGVPKLISSESVKEGACVLPCDRHFAEPAGALVLFISGERRSPTTCCRHVHR